MVEKLWEPAWALARDPKLRFSYHLNHHQHFVVKAITKVTSKVPSRPNKLVFERLRSESLAYSWHLPMDPLCKTPREQE